MTFFLLFSGAFVLTLLHTILPEHWMPFILVGKVQRWKRKKTIGVAVLAATGHVLITVVLGLVVLFITERVLGYVEEFSKIIPSIILALIGGAYIFQGLRKNHSHTHAPAISDTTTIASLVIAFSFSPCEAVIPTFILASEIGWFAFAGLSLTILAATILGMISVISLALYGYNKLELHWLEDHEKEIIGVMLILLAAIAFFF